MLGSIWYGRLGGLRLAMLIAVGLLISIGLICIHGTEGRFDFFGRQIQWIIMGVLVFIAVNLVPYRIFGEISYVLYILTLVLLGIILMGKYFSVLPWLIPRRNFAYRWINLHFMQIQPSELAKLSGILALAWYLRKRENYRMLRGLVGPFVLTLLPMLLIILEPDLGTTLLFPPVLFAMLFVAGARKRHLTAIVLIGAMLALPAYFYVLRDYQRKRIQILLHQDSHDPQWLRSEGYHLYQSKLCIGTGGLSGYQDETHKSFFYHDDNITKWLTFRYNDFIFALIAHKWGFLGAVVVIFLYLVIIIGSIEIASHQPDAFGRLLAIGIAAQILCQSYINIGMTVGLTPITGMTLPFVSYGGSSLLASFAALGLLINVARHRRRQLGPKSFEFDE